MKVLFIRLSALGDVVHTLPAASAIKNKLPDTKLSWIVEPPQIELLKNNPLIDELIVMPKSSWVSGLSSASSVVGTSKEIWKFFTQLKEKNFDVAIDFQGLLKSAFVGYASGAPIRIGYEGTRERADVLYTHKYEVGGFARHDKHIVDMHLELSEHLLRILGKSDVESSVKANFVLPPPSSNSISKISDLLQLESNEAPVLEAEQANIESREGRLNGAKEQLVVLIPGTTWDTKIWPYEKWSSLVTLIQDHRKKVKFILVGGPGDTTNNKNIQRQILESCPDANIIDTTGTTSILDLIDLFSKVDTVIGLDTGPIHLAAAIGIPEVISIHGSTPWKRNGPYGDKGHTVQLELSCQPCFKRICPIKTIECLTELSARHVFDKYLELTD